MNNLTKKYIINYGNEISSFRTNDHKLEVELQQQLLVKLKELEESSILIETLKNLSKNNKCLNGQSTSTRTGPYGYIPGIIGNHSELPNSKLVQYGELGLLTLILFLWFLSIALCFNRYSKLRTLYPVVSPHKYTTHGGPMHIEEIKVIKNEQDAIIYKKINHKTSQANLSRALKSSSGISANTSSSYKDRLIQDDKLKLSLSEPNDFNSSESNNTIVKKNSIKYTKIIPTTNQSSIDDSHRVNILTKINTRPTYFSIDNYNPPINEIKTKTDSLFKRNDPKLISMKRSLFARSKINLFTTKESINSNQEFNFNSKKNSSLQYSDLNQSRIANNMSIQQDKQDAIDHEKHFLAPDWVSQTTIEKIRENLIDLHHLIRNERRPSLLQLSKISKSESNIKLNNNNAKKSDKLVTATNETQSKKPISLSLQNPNRSFKRYDFV